MINHEEVANYFPEAYKGKTVCRGREDTIARIATELKLPPILKRFGDWAITPEGVYCLRAQYVVAKTCLDEDDWISHMQEKGWVNMNDFSEAINTAKDFVKLGII